MMTDSQVEAILGRNLTTQESDNFDQYIRLAFDRLSSILCFSFDTAIGNPRRYDVRRGYRTLWTAPFTAVNSVTVNDVVIDPTDYVTKFNDSYEYPYFNSIEFKKPYYFDKPILVDAVWGFGVDENQNQVIPDDLAQVVATLFDIRGREISEPRIERKQIEDFNIQYQRNMPSLLQSIATAYGATLAKYSVCDGDTVHGSVYPVYYR